MTVDQLREALEDLPGHALVYVAARGVAESPVEVVELVGSPEWAAAPVVGVGPAFDTDDDETRGAAARRRRPWLLP